MNMREEFEARFPTPVGVAWSDEHQNYGWVKKSAFQKTITYRALFTGWQAAQGIQEARADCVIVDEAELNSSAFTAIDMGTAAADGFRDGAERVTELEGLLGTARMYIEDLADSLANACEFFEGEDDEDPQAQGECDEARQFANRICAALGQELRP